MEVDNTRELVLQLQKGDHLALSALYDRFSSLVFRTALGITGETDAAADLMQEAFLRLYRYAERIDPERPLEPWLARVTTNLAYTWVRKRRWLRPIEEFAEVFAGEKKHTPHQAAETKEEQLQIEQAIQMLPVAQRIVITLYYINDYSLKEIADILDVPAGTVKSRLHYGREALKTQMRSQEKLMAGIQYEFT